VTSSHGADPDPKRDAYDPLRRGRDHDLASPEGPTRPAHARTSTRTVDQPGSRQELWPTPPPARGTDDRVRAASGGDLLRPTTARPPRPATAAAAPGGEAHADVDLAAAATAVSDLLDALGVDRDGEGRADTPDRVARSYAELLSPEPFEPTTFPNDEGYDELVVARSIPFSSLCEHHLLPFAGIAHVGYVPAERLLGLSKLARVVTHFSRRLQVQERLTAQISNWLVEALHPKGVGVVLEAEHACVSLRGVRAAGSMTVTSALVGLVRDDERTRAEFFSLIGHRP
jgi:GTP cyclohydrolase I